MVRVVLIGVAISLPGTGFAAQNTFDSAKEFPNYFLPREYRSSSPSSIPQNVVVESRKRLERALGSVFRRLTIPIVQPGHDRPTSVRYFPLIQSEVRKVDPNLRVLPSGGVVRSAVSYIYDEIVKGLGKTPPATAEQTLEQIVSSQADLPAFDVRGVGSDFDVLVQGPDDKTPGAIARILQITNSAEAHYDMTNEKNPMKRVFFTVGDAKPYKDQIERASRQGGATIDLLAFDIDRGEFVNPERFPKTADDMVCGLYSYAAPLKVEYLEDGAKQTIRGVRTRLELPWLKLQDESVLAHELGGLQASIQQGSMPSAKALEQFDKMVRNARYSGAHNRFYRAAPGSVDQRVMQIVDLIHAKTGVTKIPEYIETHSLSARSGTNAELNGLPEKALMPLDEFISKHTNHGVLYHGTPSIDNSLAILRQGIFVSKPGQGTAYYGRGAYSSPDLSVASSYAGNTGLVFSFEVPRDRKLNVLDWNKWKDDPWFQALQKKAAAEKRDVFELLSKEHGIDIIVNHQVLIENSEAVRLPGGLRQLLDALKYKVSDATLPLSSRLSAYKNLESLSAFSENIGIDPVTIPRSVMENLGIEVLSQRSGFWADDRIVGLRLLGNSTDPKILDVIVSTVKSGGRESHVASELLTKGPLSSVRPYLKYLLAQRENKHAVHDLAKFYLVEGRIPHTDPEFLDLVTAVLGDGNARAETDKMVLGALGGLTDERSLKLIRYHMLVAGWGGQAEAVELFEKRPLSQVRPYLKDLLAQRKNKDVVHELAKFYLAEGRIPRTDPEFLDLVTAVLGDGKAHAETDKMVLGALDGLTDERSFKLIRYHMLVAGWGGQAEALELFERRPLSQVRPYLKDLLVQRQNKDVVHELAKFYLVEGRIPRTDPEFLDLATAVLGDGKLPSATEAMVLKQLDGLADERAYRLIHFHAGLNGEGASVAKAILAKSGTTGQGTSCAQLFQTVR